MRQRRNWTAADGDYVVVGIGPDDTPRGVPGEAPRISSHSTPPARSARRLAFVGVSTAQRRCGALDYPPPTCAVALNAERPPMLTALTR